MYIDVTYIAWKLDAQEGRPSALQSRARDDSMFSGIKRVIAHRFRGPARGGISVGVKVPNENDAGWLGKVYRVCTPVVQRSLLLYSRRIRCRQPCRVPLQRPASESVGAHFVSEGR